MRLSGKAVDDGLQIVEADRVGENGCGGPACLALERVELPVRGHAEAEWHPIARQHEGHCRVLL
jgi:hypothetical protein